MPTMDAFNADAFTLTSLTAAIQQVPYQPGRIEQLGWFGTRSINTLSTFVEVQDNVLSLVDVSPRGAPPQAMEHSTRTVVPFGVPHLVVNDLLMADEITGVRAFGSESEVETLARVVAQRMAPMRSSLEYTIESHRLDAIMGNYRTVGGTKSSLFTAMDVSQQEQAMVLGTDGTAVRTKILELLEKVEDGLGGLGFTGVRVLCGKTFWSKLVEHPKVKEVYLNYSAAAELRRDPRLEFDFGGVIWERYRGTSQVKVPDAQAYAVPEGVQDLFQTAFAPADYVDTAGTLGQRLYATQWPTEGNKGIKMEAQSNPLSICTRPRAVIKCTTN